jgi:hypothetical protein
MSQDRQPANGQEPPSTQPGEAPPPVGGRPVAGSARLPGYEVLGLATFTKACPTTTSARSTRPPTAPCCGALRSGHPADFRRIRLERGLRWGDDRVLLAGPGLRHPYRR